MVELDADGIGYPPLPTDIVTSFTDNCSTASVTLSKESFTCSDIGNVPIILTGYDDAGNSGTTNIIAVVQDNIPPSITCKNTTVQLDASGNATISETDVVVSKSDNCTTDPNVLLLRGPTDVLQGFSCSDAGAPVTITVVAADASFNQAVPCEATVTVVDNIKPSANCKNASVQLDANGNASVAIADINDNSSDACGIASLALSNENFACANVGANTVTLTVTDNNGNTSTCNATVNVMDNISPAANCKTTTVQLDPSGNGSITTTDIDNGSSDNCGIASLALSNENFDCSNVGANTVTLTVTDNNSNTATCNATVIVEDNVMPAANCKTTTVQLDPSGNGSITTTDIDNGSSDNCGIASLALSNENFDCSNVGANTVTLTVTDNNSNTATCDATVIVMDNISPLANCKTTTIQLDPSGNGSITTTDLDNGSSDNCGIASLALSNENFDCSNVGTNTVTLTVTDNNGNTSTCDATVIVMDNISPVANCKTTTIQLDPSGNGSITATNITESSSDACGIASLALSNENFDCSNVGANTVILTVTDNNGNTSTCDATVTVTDVDAPTITCPGNIAVDNDPGNCGAAVSYATVTADDNCAGANVALATGLGSGATFPVGTTTESYTATDASGNQTPCSFTVTVNKTGDLGLLYGYTVIGFNEVKMSGSAVQAGGVGVVTAGQKAKFEKGNDVEANIYAREKLHAKKANGNPTYMTGLFISEDKVDSDEDVFWNWDAAACPSAPAPALLVGQVQFDAIGQTIGGKPSVDMVWVTEGDFRNSRFEVEKSIDGSSFEPVIEEAASYDNNSVHVYSSSDPSPNEGDWLYRLKVTHNNGSTSYSEMKSVRITIANVHTLFPNPTTNRTTILFGGSVTAGKVEVSDLMGRIIYRVDLEEGTEKLEIPLNGWKAGAYFVSIDIDNKKPVTKRLVVVDY